MSIDKKNKNGKKELVLLTGIGQVKSQPAYTTMIPDEHLQLLLSPSIGVESVSTPISGSLCVPGSKSLSNRILLLAAMGRGPCVVTGLLHSQDTQVMLDSLSQLGVKYAWEDGLKRLRIQGCEGRLTLPSRALFLNNAGTASRFLTTLVCLIPAGGQVTLTGNARMQERPIGDLVRALREGCGCLIEYMGPNQGCLPIRIRGTDQGLRGGRVNLAANISSQYGSSILLSAPYASGQDLLLALDQSSGKSSIVSKPFIDMTVDLMRRFNIPVAEESPFVYRVKRGPYDNPPEVLVEGDASSATYPLALAAVSGGTVTVQNVGSASLQGDAKFYRVLQDMGCEVSQTDSSTTVRGPDPARRGDKHLKALASVDMDALTDTFMTLAAVAVFAEGTTRITNVANQRVKECNRLAVMVTELAKVGVHARESETGIDIEGVGSSPEALAKLRAHIAKNHPHGLAVIACHDDHRIAMSLAIVASRVGAIVLDEKRCVDKTYPEFWEDAQNTFGIKLFPPPEQAMLDYAQGTKVVTASDSSSSSSSSSSSAAAVSSPSVILIGMRGSGKTTLGRALAKHLRRPFLDLDVILESQLGAGVSLKDFVEKEGWALFRSKELAVLTETLVAHPLGCVISCGGGVVETPAALQLLQKQNLVVQLRRDIEDVVKYLDEDRSRPGFDARSVWATREPLYVSASKYEFFICRSDADWPRIESDFFRWVDGLVGSSSSSSRPTKPAPNTFFLSLTIPDLSVLGADRAALRTHMDTLTQGVDAVEVRVDLITPVFDEEKVKSYVSTLRSVCSMPLIYTVRSKKQGGAFVDYEGSDAASNETQMVRMLELGMRVGCEFIDVEACLSAGSRARLYALRAARYPQVQIIASHHEPTNNGGSTVDDLKRLFDRCLQSAPAPHKPDVVKVVVLASAESDAFRMLQASAEIERDYAAQKGPAPAVIALAMGPLGRSTRVYNRVFTPVTHPALPSAAAPGQLSVAQIMRAREALNLAPFNALPSSPSGRKQWLLFGSPISQSPSPLLHNTGFEWLGLAPTFCYGLQDTTSVAAVAEAIARPDFGGANVTIPLKEVVAPLLPATSDAVKSIGAVNTIVRKQDGSLYGDNTDWLGVASLVRARLTSLPPASSDVCVVMGAGGTSRAAIYALQQLGFKHSNILIFNPRTTEKAATLAKEMGVNAVSSLSRASISAATQLSTFVLRVFVSTVPGSAGVRVEDAQLLQGQEDQPPVLLEASYIPADTALVVQFTRDFGVPSSHIVRGLDLLIAQGLCGFEMWIGKSIPEACLQAMVQKVREQYAKRQAEEKKQ